MGVRLIDANALTEVVEKIKWYHIDNGKLICGANSEWSEPLYKAEDIYSAIANAPTVKPVWCDECEKALTCEKRKNTEIDGCYEGIKVGDT